MSEPLTEKDLAIIADYLNIEEDSEIASIGGQFPVEEGPR